MILPEEGVDRLGWFVSRRGHENRSKGGPICVRWMQIHLASCRPFRASHFFFGFPGLKIWAESRSPFGAGPS
jgi:hypothetical protein